MCSNLAFVEDERFIANDHPQENQVDAVNGDMPKERVVAKRSTVSFLRSFLSDNRGHLLLGKEALNLIEDNNV